MKLTILLLFLVFGCARKISGTYYDSCWLYHSPGVMLSLQADKTFQYYFKYVDAPVAGTWRSINDTLVLRSPAFTAPRERFSPMQQYGPPGDSTDRFIFRRNKLLLIIKPGTKHPDCFLQKGKRR